jgi:uncharacterized repeat protein (TIGR01451 family)
LNRLGMGTRVSSSCAFLAALLLAGLGAVALWFGGHVPVPPTSTVHARGGNAAQAMASINPRAGLRVLPTQMPLIFESNRGQTDARVKFLSRGAGYRLFLTRDAAVLELGTGRRANKSEGGPHENPQDGRALSVVRMGLSGANGAMVVGDRQLPGKSNYFIGNDPAQWRRNVPQFAQVRYRNVYPGIDLLYHGRQGSLEYDFEVAPGADPRRVVLSFDGVDRVALSSDGDLDLATTSGNLRLHAPRVYQKGDNDEQAVSGRLVLLARNRVGFDIGAYDHGRALIIDPALSYSSFLGGTSNEGCFAISGVATAGCPAIAVDPGLNIYVTGPTSSPDFPTTTGAQQTTKNGATNLFVSKFDPSGKMLLFSTYLGGNGTDTSVGIAVDSGFNVYVGGTTSSTNFPTTSSNAFQTAPKAAGTHVFVSQLKSDGKSLLYSTYLSGSGTDVATGLALDNRNNAYVSGITTSSDYPVSSGAFQTTAKATNQFFYSKINVLASGASSLAYSTYVGGSTPTTGVAQGGGIAVDTNANVYVTGGTNFSDMPVLNAMQANSAGLMDAFVAKFNSSGTELYLTYLGGSGDDIGYAIAVDSGFNAYVTGSTNSSNITIPTTIKPYQACLDNPTVTPPTACPAATSADAFVAKIGNPASTSSTTYPLNYFSYLGGSADDVGLAIAVDSIQNVRVAGWTKSSDFPTSNATNVQAGFGGATDAFVARIDTTTTTSTTAGEWATFLGGSLVDNGTSVAVDANGTTYVTGDTASANFPTTSNPSQASLSGSSDIFISKLTGVSTLSFPTPFPATSTTPNPNVSPNPVGAGNQVTFTYSIVNNGPDTATNVIFNDVIPATGATFNSATASSGSCVAQPVNNVETCVIGTIVPSTSTTPNAATVKMVFTPTTAGTLGNSASVSANGSSPLANASGSATVNDFQISISSPNPVTVTAGSPASYTVVLGPLPSGTTYSSQISLSCSGLPTGATCAFSTTPVTIPSSAPVSSTLTINTTARPVSTARARSFPRPGYGTWLPVSGLALLGLGIRSRTWRRHCWLGGVVVGSLLGLILLLPACSSSKSTTSPSTGTPAGTYTVTVTGTSGTAARTTTATLVVQ